MKKVSCLSIVILLVFALAVPACAGRGTISIGIGADKAIVDNTITIYTGDTITFTVTLRNNENGNRPNTVLYTSEGYSEEVRLHKDDVVRSFTISYEMAGTYSFTAWATTGQGQGNMDDAEASIKIIVLDSDRITDFVPNAAVEKTSGSTNLLTITVTEYYLSGRTQEFTATFTIDNNAAGTYQVGPYRVYVDTKGNDEIRECYIVF